MIIEFLSPELDFQQQNYNLTPLDFYKVYADAPQPIQELKEKIRAVIDIIEPQMCKKFNGKFYQKSMVLQT